MAAPDAPEAPTDAAEKPAEEKHVPYGRFQEVNEANKQIKTQLADAQKALREREEAEMSAVEREKAARERAEHERDSAKAEADQAARGRMIARAARDAGFADPDFAAEHLVGKGEISTEAQAAKAVEQLAKRVPGLVREQNAPPQIGQVLRDGEPVDQNAASEAHAKKRFEDDLRKAVGFPSG